MTYSTKQNLTTLLSYRGEDKLYKKYSNININKELDKVVKSVVNDYVWKRHIGIGYYKDHYIKGFTLSEYVKNVLKFLGNGNYEEGMKIFNQRLQSVRNHIISKNQSYSEKDIDNALMYNIFYINYGGFLYEELIEEVLESRGFIVSESKELDNFYNIDLLVKHRDYPYEVGIQCKSISYLHISKKIKDEHLQKQINAIYNGECHTTIYLFHNDDLECVDSNNNILSIEEIINFIMKNITKFGHKKNAYATTNINTLNN